LLLRRAHHFFELSKKEDFDLHFPRPAGSLAPPWDNSKLRRCATIQLDARETVLATAAHGNLAPINRLDWVADHFHAGLLIQAFSPLTSNPVAPATGKGPLSQRRGPLGWTRLTHYPQLHEKEKTVTRV
jgi:hypothetical protein